MDGYLEGNLLSTSFVLIGKDGRIRGNVDAQEVYVSGLVEGGIRSEKVEILSGGKVKGEVQSKNVRVECSASIDGKVSI